MRHALVPIVIATAVALPAAGTAAHAGCSTPYAISTNATVQSNPDWCGGYGCYDYQGGAAVSDDIEATFWALGTGGPALGEGDDSGALAQSEWFHPFRPAGSFPNGVYYYGMTFEGSWAEPSIDGCVASAGPPGDNCTVISFSDQRDGAGSFALLSARSDVFGHFSFDRPAAAPFVLAPTPRPNVVAVNRLPPTAVEIVVEPPTVPADALYLDAGCDTALVAGYKIYIQFAAPGGGPPVDRRREQWQIAPGGAGPGGQPLPLEMYASLAFECGSQPFYLATSFVFDSGFELAHVSQQTGAIICDPFCTDLDSDGWCVFSEVPEILWDCDDSNPDVHPYAAEINDGMDNQCPGSPGFGLVDEISGEAGFSNPADRDEFGWPAQSGATLYEVARSTRPDFSEACVLELTANTVLSIAADPDPREAFHLLSRPAAPHTGSWGRSSTGVERLLACP